MSELAVLQLAVKAPIDWRRNTSPQVLALKELATRAAVEFSNDVFAYVANFDVITYSNPSLHSILQLELPTLYLERGAQSKNVVAIAIADYCIGVGKFFLRFEDGSLEGVYYEEMILEDPSTTKVALNFTGFVDYISQKASDPGWPENIKTGG